MLVQQLLWNALQQRKLSIRSAAREIGIAHTSLNRVINGERSDLETLTKVSAWLGVRPSLFVDIPVEGSDILFDRLRAVCDYQPAFKIALEGLMEGIETGRLDPAIVKEIFSYIEFRIGAVS